MSKGYQPIEPKQIVKFGGAPQILAAMFYEASAQVGAGAHTTSMGGSEHCLF